MAGATLGEMGPTAGAARSNSARYANMVHEHVVIPGTFWAPGLQQRELMMTLAVFELMHFRGLRAGETPNMDHHAGKSIGVYSSEARALDGMRHVSDQPGFRDWPDGFRLFTDLVGRAYWSQGFETGAHGADIPIARDPSGRDGSDGGLSEWSHDDTRDTAGYEDWLASVHSRRDPDTLWELRHYKIAETNGQDIEDMGLKFLGQFPSRAEAEAARRALAGKPGFRDWPGGFRMEVVALDTDHWTDGFISE